MIPDKRKLAVEIAIKLNEFKTVNDCPGIEDEENFHSFVAQIVDSVRRTIYFNVLLKRGISSDIFANPFHKSFHPLKAAVWQIQEGNREEAFWLVFLFVHFGKNKKTAWGLAQNVYNNLGEGPTWTWNRVTNQLDEFCNWLKDNQSNLEAAGNFGNHRKYESFKPGKTNATFHSYVTWIQEQEGHLSLFDRAIEASDNDYRKAFRHLFIQMKTSVYRFGRTAVFDYLSTIGKLELASIVPDSIYFSSATGPKKGARLLFTGNPDAKVSSKSIEQEIAKLETHLGLYFGMQVLEDSLCNWQKSPDQYLKFTA